MARYDDTFVDRFLEPWNRHDVDGALALMTADGRPASTPTHWRLASSFRRAPRRRTSAATRSV